jgi:mannose-6-phosphate isomerase-like protein (cupin superfamily)
MPPHRIAVADVPLESETPGFHVAVLVDRRDGSKLLTGIVRMEVGEESIAWTPSGDIHETYFVELGRLEIRWEGPTTGTEVVGPQEAFYFPPEHSYALRNVGEEQIRLIYSLVPSPES